MRIVQGTLMPFLYPCLLKHSISHSRVSILGTKILKAGRTVSTQSGSELASEDSGQYTSHLNPSAEDYGRSIFTDKCTLKVEAGSGGNGCVSFLREKFIEEGPPNGGDGGSGGNIYIQAVKGEKSLHKLARRGIIRAGRGKNGMGKSRGGQRGEDILLEVPVGTVVREISRIDPVAIEEEEAELAAGRAPEETEFAQNVWKRNKWLLAPSGMPADYTHTAFPALPRPRRSNLAPLQPPAPINLDLSKPMEKPILLAAGAVGGLGNARFVTKSIVRPKFATKGDYGMKLELELELKIWADLGFVGMPNAGKSTLLRALSRSRARVGNWAFTTLQPNVGTVVLDNNEGRPQYEVFEPDGSRRTHFTIADIPGLVPDAHLDRGLGLDFLRHIERARVLAFVVDLSQGDAVQTLKVLQNELKEYERLKEIELNEGTEQRLVNWQSYAAVPPQDGGLTPSFQPLPAIQTTPISSKPWFVIANKADMEGTQKNYIKLKEYVQESGALSIPVSAIRGEGVERIAKQTISLLSNINSTD
jgi:GTPase